MIRQILAAVLVLIGLFGIFGCANTATKETSAIMPEEIVQKNYVGDNRAEIYLAGGCFWGTEALMRQVRGVESVESGYANGETSNPNYREVCSGSGHAETVHVIYNPELVSLQELLAIYFKSINPTAKNRQGNDRGIQYRTGIYYSFNRDEEVITQSLADLQRKYDKPLAVEFGRIVNFYRAEEEHQEYLIKNPNGYCHIPQYIFDEIHKEKVADNTILHTPTTNYRKPDQSELKQRLTLYQYAVTQKAATEPPFNNAYYNEFRAGIYCDITTGQPLFVSTTKFESNCGWPSFSRPIDNSLIEERADNSFAMRRTEVLARASGAHLGHVFNDGPREMGGLRYCINSASLRFIPREKMAAEGYGEFIKLLDEGRNDA